MTQVVYWQAVGGPHCSRGFDTYDAAETFLIALGAGVRFEPYEKLLEYKYVESSEQEPYGDTMAAHDFAESVTLFATNTGEWHMRHKSIATVSRAVGKPRFGVWRERIRQVILPAWRRECGALPGLDSPIAIQATAESLATYYADYIAKSALAS